MADNNFFDDKTNQEEASEKIKVGDMEFDPDELNQLVSYGKKAKEIEEGAKQPIEKIYESWGRRGRDLGELKKKVEEYEKEKLETEKPQEIKDKEAFKEQIKKELMDVFGDEVLTKKQAEELFRNEYQTNRSGERILARTNKVIRNSVKMGYPNVEVPKLLEFMAHPDNPKDPEKAYKLMFEREIDQIKEQKLASIRPKSMYTNQASTAGSKSFERKSMRGMSSEDLRKMFRDTSPE